MVRREEGGQQAASGEGVWGAANRLIKSVIGGWPDADQPAQSTGAPRLLLDASRSFQKPDVCVL